jgi:hypothetical protein
LREWKAPPLAGALSFWFVRGREWSSLAAGDQERRYSVLRMKSSQINAKLAKESRSTRGRSPGNNPTVNSVKLLRKTTITPAAAMIPKMAEITHTIERRIFIV